MLEWRDIPGFEGAYQASACGQIRSLERTVIGSRGVPVYVPGCIKTQRIDRYGYPVVGLAKGGSKIQAYTVHPLVLAAFAGPKPHPMFQACHNDGNRANNAISNLRWASPAENYNDRRAHGTDASGDRNPSAKLTAAQARLMKSLKGKFTHKELSGLFAVSRSAVQRIVYGIAWRNQTAEYGEA
jgi:hypothetical protein